MRALFRALVAVSLLVGLVTSGITRASHAQVMPGERGASSNQMRSAHEKYAREQVDATLERLQTAIAARNARQVAELYMPDATILTDVNFLQGRGAIHDRYAGALPRIRNFRVTVQGFEASGVLAFVLGSVRYDVTLSTGGTLEVETPVSFVIRDRRFGWLIQSQTGGLLPATLSLQEKPPARMRAGDSVTVNVRVLDASGLAMPRVLVVFEADVGNASFRPVTAHTNGAGVATSTIRVGNDSGLVVVRATAGGVIAEPLFFSIAVAGQDAAP